MHFVIESAFFKEDIFNIFLLILLLLDKHKLPFAVSHFPKNILTNIFI